MNFLADLFKQGYQYRYLNANRSAVSSVYDRLAVGQHPLVTQLLKAVFNLRPPQPGYTSIWDVSQVLVYLEGLEENSTCMVQNYKKAQTMEWLPAILDYTECSHLAMVDDATGLIVAMNNLCCSSVCLSCSVAFSYALSAITGQSFSFCIKLGKKKSASGLFALAYLARPDAWKVTRSGKYLLNWRSSCCKSTMPHQCHEHYCIQSN